MSLPTSFPSTYDFRLLTNIVPFYDAINRRLLALGGASLGTPAIGDDCSGAGCTYTPPGVVARAIFNIDALQGAIISMAGAFIDSSLIGSLSTYTVTYTGGGASILPLMEWQTSGGDADEATSGPNILKRIGCTVDRNGNYNLTRKRPARIIALTQLDPTDGVTVIAGLYDDTLLNAANDTPAIGAIAYYDPTKISVNYSGFGFWPAYPDQNAGSRFILSMVAGVKTWVKCPDQRVKPNELTGWGIATAGDYLGPWIWQQIAAIFPLCKDQKLGASIDGHENSADVNATTHADLETTAANEAGAKADALSVYNSNVNLDATGVGNIGGYASYSVNSAENDTADSYNAATLVRANVGFLATGHAVVKTSSRTINYYAWVVAATTHPFDKLGDSVPDLNKMTLVASDTPGTAAATFSATKMPGTMAAPGWPTTQTHFHTPGSNIQPYDTFEGGWQMGSYFAIVKWSFTD